MAGDSFYNNVTLLLHGNGSNGSTTFTDNSGSPKTATVIGSPIISTAQSQFGGSSIRVSPDDILVFGDASIASLGASDFTIECWAKLDAGAISWYFNNRNGGAANASFGITCDSDGTLQAYGRSGSSFIGYCTAYSTGLGSTAGHVAFTRQGSTFRLFANGVQVATATSSTALNTSPSGDIQLYSANQWPEDTFKAYFDEVRITVGTARYTANFTPPTEAHPYGLSIAAHVAVPGPLGPERVLGTFAVSVPAQVISSAPAVFGSAVATVRHDFGTLVQATLSAMDLITPGGTVRVPISSWQATLQTTDANYVQCVIPACTQWGDSINAATEFVIYRRAPLPGGGALEYEMARAPAEQVRFDRGPGRHTCTLAGYSPGFAEDLDPPATFDRALTGVRSISSGATDMRVRCAVDWLLRPGHRAFVEGVPFVVDYINYYAPSGFDAYMDVGSRS